MTPGSIAVMKLLNLSKRWKYFAKSLAIVSSEKFLHGVFVCPPGPTQLEHEMKPARAMTRASIKTRTHLKK